MAAAAAEAKAQYSAILLGATGNVGGRIVQLLIKNPLCKKVVVVTRRKMDAFADPKVSEVVVNMDRLEEEVAPHAPGSRRLTTACCHMPPAAIQKIVEWSAPAHRSPAE